MCWVTFAPMLPSEYDVILHLGLPKTGTTTLQQHFFPHLDAVNYFGVLQPRQHNGSASFNALKSFVVFGKGRLEDARRILDEEIKKGLPVLISEEEILIGQFHGAQKGDATSVSYKEKIERLANVVEGRKTLAVVALREFRSGLFSYYVELSHLFGPKEDIPSLVKSSDLFGIWRYPELETTLTDAFGSDVVWQRFPDNMKPATLQAFWGAEASVTLPRSNSRVKSPTHVEHTSTQGLLLMASRAAPTSKLGKLFRHLHRMGWDLKWKKRAQVPFWGPEVWEQFAQIEAASNTTMDKVCGALPNPKP